QFSEVARAIAARDSVENSPLRARSILNPLASLGEVQQRDGLDRARSRRFLKNCVEKSAMDVDSTPWPEASHCPPFRRREEAPERRCRVFADGRDQHAIDVANTSTRFWERRREGEFA